jgi:hypothetical protein
MSASTAKSPRILRVSWGHMEVEGLGVGKDLKLFPGGGEPWDWNESRMQHIPGILPGDIEELLQRGCEEIVLSRGMLQALHASPEALLLLEEREVPFYLEETRVAVALSNRLAREGKRVGGLFHSTC